jgi:GNAT superfamily N-acetyltransferase
LRLAQAEDFDQLARLAVACADTGRIRVAPTYLRNPVQAWAALKPELEWVLAEAGGEVVGAAQVIFSETIVEGERRKCACLASLMVDPAHRRQGIARALTEWRLDRAGPEAVVVAAIQTGNVGSLANARHWATQIFGTLVFPLLRAGGAPRGSFEIRAPRDESEWASAAAGLDEFERDWNLRTPETGETLRDRADRRFEGEQLQPYFVAVEGSAVVGGYQFFAGGRLQALVFEQLPAPLRALNMVLRLLPRGGELRQSSLSRSWYAPGRTDVARALWAHARSLAAEYGTAIGTQFDPRGPLRHLVPVRPWTPKGHTAVAVRCDRQLSEDSLVSPP